MSPVLGPSPGTMSDQSADGVDAGGWASVGIFSRSLPSAAYTTRTSTTVEPRERNASASRTALDTTSPEACGAVELRVIPFWRSIRTSAVDLGSIERSGMYQLYYAAGSVSPILNAGLGSRVEEPYRTFTASPLSSICHVESAFSLPRHSSPAATRKPIRRGICW